MRTSPLGLLLAVAAARAAPSRSDGVRALQADDAKRGSSSFVVYSPPIDTRYGEVFNYRDDGMEPIAAGHSNSSESPFPMPADVLERYANASVRTMAISGFEFEFVRRHDNGSETPIPLYELYLHHMNINLYSAAGVTGFGTSFEYRHTSFMYEAPYRRHLTAPPQSWYPFMHLINTRLPNGPRASPSPLIECPCTPQRKIDAAAGTVDGHALHPAMTCGPNLAGNAACSLERYVAGLHCCHHRGDFVIDTRTCEQPGCAETPVDRAYFRMTVHYEDATPRTRHIGELPCCDVTTNAELDVEECPPGTPPSECTFTIEGVQPLDPQFTRENADDVWELAQAYPHLHEGGISVELQDAVTNRTVCAASRADGTVIYGTGAAAGDEEGYVVGFTVCRWSAGAERFTRSHPMRVIAVYDASRRRSGLMGTMILVGHREGHVSEQRDTYVSRHPGLGPRT
jgi:hypothetical protein